MRSQIIEEEIEVLQSIWPDIRITDLDDGTVKLNLAVDLELSKTTQCMVFEEKDAETFTKLDLQYLPAALVEFLLSPSHPELEGPQVKISSSWELSGDRWLENLKDDMLALYAGDSVIYTMIDHLQHVLDGQSSLRIYSTNRRIAQQKESLAARLASYNQHRSNRIFDQETFSCCICLEDYKGKACIRLSQCQHVFCTQCLHGYFSMSIHEGLLMNIVCPEPSCVQARKLSAKENSTNLPGLVDEQELLPIVGEEMLARYRFLKEKQRVESDPTITFCPRPTCQAAVEKDKDDSYDKLRTCTKCGHSYCVFCRRTYHGVSPCKMKSSEGIVERYLNGSEQDQLRLDQQYVSKVIKRLVDQYLEDKANLEWLSGRTQACPGCSVNVEKSHGCSHMSCAKCQTHFCFRCGQKLIASDPYRHFSTAGACFNKLFDYEPEAPENEAMHWDAIAMALDGDE